VTVTLAAAAAGKIIGEAPADVLPEHLLLESNAPLPFAWKVPAVCDSPERTSNTHSAELDHKSDSTVAGTKEAEAAIADSSAREVQSHNKSLLAGEDTAILAAAALGEVVGDPADSGGKELPQQLLIESNACLPFAWKTPVPLATPERTTASQQSIFGDEVPQVAGIARSRSSLPPGLLERGAEKLVNQQMLGNKVLPEYLMHKCASNALPWAWRTVTALSTPEEAQASPASATAPMAQADAGPTRPEPALEARKLDFDQEGPVAASSVRTSEELAAPPTATSQTTPLPGNTSHEGVESYRARQRMSLPAGLLEQRELRRPLFGPGGSCSGLPQRLVLPSSAKLPWAWKLAPVQALDTPSDSPAAPREGVSSKEVSVSASESGLILKKWANGSTEPGEDLHRGRLYGSAARSRSRSGTEVSEECSGPLPAKQDDVRQHVDRLRQPLLRPVGVALPHVWTQPTIVKPCANKVSEHPTAVENGNSSSCTTYAASSDSCRSRSPRGAECHPRTASMPPPASCTADGESKMRALQPPRRSLPSNRRPEEADERDMEKLGQPGLSEVIMPSGEPLSTSPAVKPESKQDVLSVPGDVSEALEPVDVPNVARPLLSTVRQQRPGWKAAAALKAPQGQKPRSRSPRRSLTCEPSALRQKLYIIDGLNVLRKRNRSNQGFGEIALDWDQLQGACKYYTQRGHQISVFLPPLRSDQEPMLDLFRERFGDIFVLCQSASDDRFMINTAKLHEAQAKEIASLVDSELNNTGPSCFIVTNDRFEDWRQKGDVDGSWIQRHCVRFAFGPGGFVPSELA